MLRIGVLASHQGTNFQAISDACSDGSLSARIVLLICNNSTAPVMNRARSAAIPTAHLSSATNPDDLDRAICESLTRESIDLLVLAGYMKKLGPAVLSTFKDRIINVHPSLLPHHGGEGLYGDRVHQAVLDAGDRQSGATVHQVTAGYDEGAVILQKSVPVLANDNVDSLATRIRPLEHQLLIAAINKLSTKLTRN
jgi:phosphoribosylglycinamide formyltransferase-1